MCGSFARGSHNVTGLRFFVFVFVFVSLATLAASPRSLLVVPSSMGGFVVAPVVADVVAVGAVGVGALLPGISTGLLVGGISIGPFPGETSSGLVGAIVGSRKGPISRKGISRWGPLKEYLVA